MSRAAARRAAIGTLGTVSWGSICAIISRAIPAMAIELSTHIMNPVTRYASDEATSWRPEGPRKPKATPGPSAKNPSHAIAQTSTLRWLTRVAHTRHRMLRMVVRHKGHLVSFSAAIRQAQVEQTRPSTQVTHLHPRRPKRPVPQMQHPCIESSARAPQSIWIIVGAAVKHILGQFCLEVPALVFYANWCHGLHGLRENTMG